MVEILYRSLIVTPEQHRERLDKILSRHIPERSRSYLQHLVSYGTVKVNDIKIRKSATLLHAGDHIAIGFLPTPDEQPYLPQAIPLNWQYKDEHIGVLNKLAGLVVHPAAGHWNGTLLNALLAEDDKAVQLPRGGIVHRLDKDTSGLMVVARSKEAMEKLATQIAHRQVNRKYHALVHGSWHNQNPYKVENIIGRHPKNRLKMAVLSPQNRRGKSAKTEIFLQKQHKQISWVTCKLYTGRTHQIRVHLSHLKYPIVGDKLYGGHHTLGIERQALHAFYLGFKHPITQESLAFFTTLPEDMRIAMKNLGFNIDNI